MRSSEDTVHAVEVALAGRLELEHLLGQGATGSVRRARSLAPMFGRPEGSYFAIKIVRPEVCTDENAVARFRREAEISQRLDDPRVVKIHAIEAVETGSGTALYSIQDYVEGRTLRQFLREHGACSDALVRTIGLDAARGLDALHRRGIVHRDIKPENLLITADSEVRLVDFGLAHSTEGVPGSGSGVHGTPAYAAPEVLRGRRHGAPADLYALGLVLYELATGQHPFARPDGSADALFHASLHETPRPVSHTNPSLSTFLDELLAHLLAKDPARRPKDAATLVGILQRGEGSRFWQNLAAHAPLLASRRSLESLARPRPTRFVNRSTEVNRLERFLAESRRGRPRAVEVLGLRGIGRRRLCDEVCDRWIEDRRAVVFLGRSAPADASTRGDAPLADLLREWLLPAARDDDPLRATRLRYRAREALGSVLPESRVDRLAAMLHGQPAENPDERVDLLADAFVAIARTRGTTVVRIDRAEQLGSVATSIIRRTLTDPNAPPLLWILVSPRGIREHTIATERMTVEGLERRPFIELGRELFAPSELRHRARLDVLLGNAARAFSGSPMALIECLEAYVERGQLQGQPGSFHSLAPDVQELRPAVSEIERLHDRLEALPAATLHAIRAAAVLGQDFSLDDAAKLVGRPVLELLEQFEDLEQRLIEIDGDRGRFRHREYRRVVLSVGRPEDLRRLHRTAAWVLQDRAAPALEVALHLSRAGEHEACIDPLLDGLEQRMFDGSLRMASRLARRCQLHLDAMGDPERDSERRARWTDLTARLAMRRGRPSIAVEAFRELARLGHDRGDDRQSATAALGLAEVAQAQGRYFESLQHLANAEDRVALQDGRFAVLEARIALVHGRVFAYLGQGRDALRVTRAGLSALQRVTGGSTTLEDSILRFDLKVDLARWQALRQHLERALHEVESVLEEAQAVDLPRTVARARLAHARVLTQRGSRRRVQRSLDAVATYCRRSGDYELEARMRLATCELRLFGSAAKREPEAIRNELAQATEAGRLASDRFVIELTTAYRHWCGEGAPRPEPPPHDVPVLSLAWHAAVAHRLRNEDEDRAESILEDAVTILRRVDVPLHLHLAILRGSGRSHHADRLVASIRERFRDAHQGRRFSTYASRVGLDPFEV